MNASSQRLDFVAPASLDLAFRFGNPRRGGREVLFLFLALAVHGGLSLGVGRLRHTPREVVAVTEIELPPAPPPEPPRPVEEPKKEEPVATAKALAAPPPQAARAGALVTAKDDPKAATKDDDLVSFVTDPNGTSYGSGVVARGGTAERGAASATPLGVGSVTPPGPAAPRADGLVAAENLSRRARLGDSNACAGFYPNEANVDSGSVTLTVVVAADGRVMSVAVVSELPQGQGFSKAARSCLQGKRFEPSLDKAGVAVAAATSIKLRFVR